MAGGSSEPGRTAASRVLGVLGAFTSAHSVLGLSSIARRSGLPLSTAHRLIAELEDWGALTRRSDGLYEVGPRLWELGLLAPVNRELRQVALPYMQDVLATTGENVQLAVRDGTGVLYVERIHGNDAVPLVSTTGTRLPMHATGVGKVLLADAPQLVQHAVLGALEQVTPQTITDPVRLRQQLAEVRKRGFARTLDEMSVGTASLAVPVRDAWGVTRAALGVVVTNTRRDLTRQLPALQVAARGIGRQLALPE